MLNSEREAFDKLVNDTVEAETLSPLQGRHRQRWLRIKEIDTALKAITALHAGRKQAKHETPYHETDEWKALVYEGNLLEEIERTYALQRDWPVWQEGQHFTYLDTSNNEESLREGEVISFDLEADTIECSTWPLHDFHGYVGSPGSRKFHTVTIAQIDAAVTFQERLEAARRHEQAQINLVKDKERLPLFADQMVSTNEPPSPTLLPKMA